MMETISMLGRNSLAFALGMLVSSPLLVKAGMINVVAWRKLALLSCYYLGARACLECSNLSIIKVKKLCGNSTSLNLKYELLVFAVSVASLILFFGCPIMVGVFSLGFSVGYLEWFTYLIFSHVLLAAKELLVKRMSAPPGTKNFKTIRQACEEPKIFMENAPVSNLRACKSL